MGKRVHEEVLFLFKLGAMRFDKVESRQQDAPLGGWIYRNVAVEPAVKARTFSL